MFCARKARKLTLPVLKPQWPSRRPQLALPARLGRHRHRQNLVRIARRIRRDTFPWPYTEMAEGQITAILRNGARVADAKAEQDVQIITTIRLSCRIRRTKGRYRYHHYGEWRGYHCARHPEEAHGCGRITGALKKVKSKPAIWRFWKRPRTPFCLACPSFGDAFAA